jgi:hypothetical protein
MGKAPNAQREKHGQQRDAGKKSGSKRAELAKIRLLVVKAAFGRLSRPNQMQPSSLDTIKALQEECTKIPSIERNGDDFDSLVSLLLDGKTITLDVPRETLRKDLQLLGIRSRRKAQRSG